MQCQKVKTASKAKSPTVTEAVRGHSSQLRQVSITKAGKIYTEHFKYL